MFRPLFELLCLLMGPPLAGGPREHPWLMSPSSVLLKDHIMGLCLLKGYVDTWLMSLAPTIGESVCLRKSKNLSEEKSPVRAKPKNNPVFKETCGLWKHKTSLRKRILCQPCFAKKKPLGEGKVASCL